MSRLAVIFDFDSTLAADSTTAFLEAHDVDTQQFWKQRVQARIELGWDPIPAYLYEMVALESNGDRVITQSALASFGESHALYAGVEQVFDVLREEAGGVDERINIEFYLISSGIGEILRRTAIAHRFRDIWACEFHYDESGRIVYPRNIVSFTEKTRFLFQISKGLVGAESRQNIEAVNRRFEGGQFTIPFRNMIFVGDGMTDVPCFALVKRYGGHAIGVYDPHAPNKWGPAWELVRDQRVVSIHQADYSPGSDLSNTLRMAVRAAAEAAKQSK